MPSALNAARPSLVGRRVEQDLRIRRAPRTSRAASFPRRAGLRPSRHSRARRSIARARGPPRWPKHVDRARSSRTSRRCRHSPEACPARPSRSNEARSPAPARPARHGARRNRAPRPDRSRAGVAGRGSVMPARLWPMPTPIAPFSSWTHSAMTARSKRGSAIPGIASSSLPDRKARLIDHRYDNEPLRRGGQGLRPPYAEPICRFIRYAKETIHDHPSGRSPARRASRPSPRADGPQADHQRRIFRAASASRCSRCPAPSRRPARRGTCPPMSRRRRS